MKERPIIFSADMVNAILAGNKTQTRRVVKPQRHPYGEMLTPDEVAAEFIGNTCAIRCKYGKIGDKLWVRENCRAIELESGEDVVQYMSDMAIRSIEHTQDAADKWIDLHNYANDYGRIAPSIHMPRWASRILIEITDIRVERLKDISEVEAKAEGTAWEACGSSQEGNHKAGFASLWESINGAGSWNINPFVWVISFKRVEK